MELDLKAIAEQIHYPEHWDTVAYPTLESAIHEILMTYQCQECKCVNYDYPQ